MCHFLLLFVLLFMPCIIEVSFLTPAGFVSVGFANGIELSFKSEVFLAMKRFKGVGITGTFAVGSGLK